MPQPCSAGWAKQPARMLKDAGGIPAYGNLPEAWQAGTRSDFENPEYR
ncbi:MAG: flavodoxin [Arthrobacter sp.]|nr:flavodoxin [Arthrobacter sp.]